MLVTACLHRMCKQAVTELQNYFSSNIQLSSCNYDAFANRLFNPCDSDDDISSVFFKSSTYQSQFILPNNITSASDNQFDILYLNCRSIRHKFDHFQLLLNNINRSLDVVVLTESWLDGKNDTTYSIPTYNMYSKPRLNVDDNLGGAICVYVKQKFTCSSLTLPNMNIKSFEHHEIFISLNCCTFCIVSIYRPPNLSLLTFLQEFQVYIETVCSCLDKSCQLFCVGDYNINLLHCDINQQVASFVQLMYSHLLYPTILRPTRVTHKSATLTDNIFTTVPSPQLLLIIFSLLCQV